MKTAVSHTISLGFIDTRYKRSSVVKSTYRSIWVIKTHLSEMDFLPGAEKCEGPRNQGCSSAVLYCPLMVEERHVLKQNPSPATKSLIVYRRFTGGFRDSCFDEFYYCASWADF